MYVVPSIQTRTGGRDKKKIYKWRDLHNPARRDRRLKFRQSFKIRSQKRTKLIK